MKLQSYKILLMLSFVVLAATKEHVRPLWGKEHVFATEVFNTLTHRVQNRNIFISTAYVRSCLALLYLGAAGVTECQLGVDLHLATNRTKVANQFKKFLNKMGSKTGVQIKMANRIFVNENYDVEKNFNDTAEQFFNSAVEKISVIENEASAMRINMWFEQQMGHKMYKIVKPEDINKETKALVVNTVDFKAKWEYPFTASQTTKQSFAGLHIKDHSGIVKVDMMYQLNKFPYAELEDLAVKALLMSFLGTDIKMLLLRPNRTEGIKELHKKIRNVELTDIVKELKLKDVGLFLPKFKIVFTHNLAEPLKLIGMTHLFSEKANLRDFFGGYVSQFVHQAAIEVNENGAQISSYEVIMRREKNRDTDVDGVYEFKLNRPFFFALLDQRTVYFVGNVITFP